MKYIRKLNSLITLSTISTIKYPLIEPYMLLIFKVRQTGSDVEMIFEFDGCLYNVVE